MSLRESLHILFIFILSFKGQSVYFQLFWYPLPYCFQEKCLAYVVYSVKTDYTHMDMHTFILMPSLVLPAAFSSNIAKIRDSDSAPVDIMAQHELLCVAPGSLEVVWQQVARYDLTIGSESTVQATDSEPCLNAVGSCFRLPVSFDGVTLWTEM